MSEWQKGDLALCVSDVPQDARPFKVRKGRIYTVDSIHATPWGLGLAFHDVHPGHTYFARRFRKVTPPKADEFDREVIEAMTGAPVGEPA